MRKILIAIPLVLLYFTFAGLLAPDSPLSGVWIIVGFVFYLYGIEKVIAWFDRRRARDESQ